MISVKDLTKNYGELCALDHVEFKIHSGEVLGLLGPNGAGKTTFMRILTCYLNPTGGTIEIKDMNVFDNQREIKSIMGYLPENAPLYPDLLVFDYLNYVADTRGLSRSEKKARIDYLARICGIREVMHQAIGELSKGYKQRVGIAQAMMGDPEILVLDEPTSGLDPNQIADIREIIREIGREKTVIFSTHILSEAEATCDRVLIINKGRIVADGNINEIKESAGRDSQIFLTLQNARSSDVESLLGKIPGVKEIQPGEEKREGRVGFVLTCNPDQDPRAQVYHAIKSREWDLVEFYQKSKSLENIFRELTKENSQ